MDMESIVQRYCDELHHHRPTRRKIKLSDLERYVRDAYSDAGRYQQAGGYAALYRIVTDGVKAQRLEPIKSAKGNGRQPELCTVYWSVPERPSALWSDLDMVRVSDRLQLSAYVRQPELQSPEEWARIERLYAFMRNSDRREWVTREERSLELFDSEKWLSEEQGLQFLRRVGVTLADLKAKVHGEPFVFWPMPGIRLHQAKEALVLENLSLFHTIRRVLEQDGQVAGLQPDLLIYGEGKKIEASLIFLGDLTDMSEVQVHYAGDIDPEGWSIYLRLKRKYDGSRIRLAIPLYEAMLPLQKTVPIGSQIQDESTLQAVLEELRSVNGSPGLLAAIQDCWRKRLRLPQEVLTVETLRQGANVEKLRDPHREPGGITE